MRKTIFNSPKYNPKGLNFAMDEISRDETKQPIDPRSYPFDENTAAVLYKRKKLPKMNDSKP